MKQVIKEFGLSSFWMVNKTLTKKIGIQQTVILQHLIDLQNNVFGGKEFFQQQERLMEEFNLSRRQISQSIDELITLELITCNKKGVPAKNYYFVQEQKVMELLSNNTSTESDSDNIQSNDVKSVEVIDNTSNIEKVQQSEEKQDDIEIPTTIFKQNKVEIKKIELNKDLLSTLLDEPEPDLEFLN
jgi:DNA-binding transcriptional regulator GbsR (MarR family)